jgi:hypothetical protein
MKPRGCLDTKVWSELSNIPCREPRLKHFLSCTFTETVAGISGVWLKTVFRVDSMVLLDVFRGIITRQGKHRNM